MTLELFFKKNDVVQKREDELEQQIRRVNLEIFGNDSFRALQLPVIKACLQ